VARRNKEGNREFSIFITNETNSQPGAWYPDNYYTKLTEISRDKRESVIADEIQANMGSLYFTDRELFNSYKDILPNAMSLVEIFIKEGKYENEQH